MICMYVCYMLFDKYSILNRYGRVGDGRRGVCYRRRRRGVVCGRQCPGHRPGPDHRLSYTDVEVSRDRTGLDAKISARLGITVGLKRYGSVSRPEFWSRRRPGARLTQ